MHYKIKRLIETTVPLILLNGIILIYITDLIGIKFALIALIIFSTIDVLFTTRTRIIPKNIQYDGKYFRSLIELINYVKQNATRRK